MDGSDLFSLLSVGLAAASVPVPFLIRWIERRNRLHRSTRFIELLRTRDALENIQSERQDSLPEPTLKKLRAHILEINEELEKIPENRIGVPPYLYAVTVEVVLLASLILARVSVILDKVIHGEVTDSGIGFFEGIFGFPWTRLLLLMVCISLSVIITTMVGRFLEQKLYNKHFYNVTMFVVFNIVFVSFVIAGAGFLALLDPYTKWF